MEQPPLSQTPRGPITWRSVSLGLLGVVIICGLTPYNDYALNNTFLIGNNLPLGVTVLAFLFALCVNGPLSRYAPRHALSSGEVAVAFSMTLVSCALPSSGLMRYFPASLVIPFQLAQSNGQWLALLERMHVPRWLWPSFQGAGPREWMNDPIVTGFAGRWFDETPPPYAAWIVPAMTWGVFIFALYGALLFIVAIVRRQWYENERLPFPLAQIQLALVEQPRPGRWLNDALRGRTFWLAFTAVFLLHAWNGLSSYHGKYFPTIWIYYDLHRLFTEPPWIYVDSKIKDAAVFFSVVGVTYFLSSSVAFSLWAFYVLDQLYRMYLGTFAGDPSPWGQHDQHFGGILAFFLAIVWVGRRQWQLVIAQALRGERAGEPRGRYLHYGVAVWGLVGCTLVMIGWLMLAGATFVGAAVMVLLLLVLFVIITRIIAETGLIHGQLQVPIYKPWTDLSLAGVDKPVPVETFFLGSFLQGVHYDFREVVPVYASHGLKVTDETVFAEPSTEPDPRRERRTGRKIFALLALALLVGYVVSFGATLWTEYHYAWTQDISGRVPINEWGAYNSPNVSIVGATLQYDRQTYDTVHSPWRHMTFGFLFTGCLSFLRLRYTWWPLHPIGYLMIGTYPGAHLWFSIMLGWLAKTLIVKFGGPGMFTRAKPLFLGLIVGESAAAGLWLMTGIVLNALGVPYRAINIMPG